MTATEQRTTEPAKTPNVFTVGGRVDGRTILVQDRESGIGFYLTPVQAQLLASRLLCAAPIQPEAAGERGL